MRNKLGIVCMVLGVAMVLSALALFLYNQQEDRAAGEAAELVLPQIIERIDIRTEVQQSQTPMQDTAEPAVPQAPEVLWELATPEMPVAEIDGHEYIGYLSIPTLGLELPVMADWDYDKLKIAPCRYYGSVAEDDLVVMAHNYVRHFKSLSKLTEGDQVTFTDMAGGVIRYEVTAKDVLPATAIDEMTAGSADLTLFTCTYSRQERVTVYCDRVAGS